MSGWKIISIQNLNAQGEVASVTTTPSVVGSVTVILKRGALVNGTYKGKGLEGHEFAGTLIEIDTADNYCFKGQMICGDDLKLMEKKGIASNNKSQGTFEGSFKNGKKHGKGVYKFANGGRIEGVFENDQLKSGTYYYRSGDKYVGELKPNAKRQGEGTFLYKSGLSCGRRWENGILLKGWIRYASSNYFEGEFHRVENKMIPKNGKVFYYADNDGFYDGEFNIDGELHGSGSFHSGSGDVVSGVWDKDSISEGKIYFSDSTVFEGTFDGWKTRTKLNGSWRLTNGDVYEGPFANDLPEGKALLRHSDGSVFDGFFVRGMQHGMGRLIKADGSITTGEWKHGILQKVHSSTTPVVPLPEKAYEVHGDVPFADSI